MDYTGRMRNRRTSGRRHIGNPPADRERLAGRERPADKARRRRTSGTFDRRATPSTGTHRRPHATGPFAAGCLAGALCAACGAGGPEPDPGPRSDFQPTATVEELMRSVIDPAADGLWDAVVITSTLDGIERRVPDSDEDWLALEHHAVRLLEALFATGDEPPPAAYFSMALARHLSGSDEEALDWAERGLRVHPAPAENHYALASGLNLQLERWARARELLAEMVRLFPAKAIYWRQLVAASLSMDDEEQALVASELGYRRGLLREGDDVLRLARLYLYHEFPHKAARLLARGMDDGVVEATTDNYELLASAWINAREHARAIAPLQKAAQRADDGKLFLRLARLWVEDEDWPRAHQSLEQALERGGLDDEPGARLLHGIVLAKRNRTAEAKAEFNYCLGFQATKTEATRWLEYIAGRE